jgi:hypothetical protein
MEAEMKLVTTPKQALKNISQFNEELPDAPGLVDRLGLVHAWYIDAREPELPKFGFSKFIGYDSLSAISYLQNYKNLDGRNTEWALKSLAMELNPDSEDFQKYHQWLVDWLSVFGKTPRKNVRLFILNEGASDENIEEDSRLLELLVAVADLLPLSQRLDLRSRL